jgi:Ca2+-binding RTX toxin-like protein
MRVLLLLALVLAVAGVETAMSAARGDDCGEVQPGEQCGPGNGRQTPGGAGTSSVSHAGWPAITGVLWKVLSEGRGRHSYTGGKLNDELLGHHGDDTVDGGEGRDVLWGDWDPTNNNSRQSDKLIGGPGADWLYTSHGRNVVRGGSGNDYVWAYYGRGEIDCGAGQDTLRVRLNAPYKYSNCERIKNFCAHGSKPGGGCYKPGEKPARR